MITAKHFNGLILSLPETTGNFHPKFTPMRFRLAGIRLSRPESPRFQNLSPQSFNTLWGFFFWTHFHTSWKKGLFRGSKHRSSRSVWLEDFGRLGVTEQKKIMPTWLQMDVSENSGTPKSSILIGCSIINHPFWGTPIFGNTQMLWMSTTWCGQCYYLWFQTFQYCYSSGSGERWVYYNQVCHGRFIQKIQVGSLLVINGVKNPVNNLING